MARMRTTKDTKYTNGQGAFVSELRRQGERVSGSGVAL
jgi:hypothetical protein